MNKSIKIANNSIKRVSPSEGHLSFKTASSHPNTRNTVLKTKLCRNNYKNSGRTPETEY
jgi:hypothetical protein